MGESTSERLHRENKKMEDRLKQLKNTLKKRKEQRGGQSVIWRSGKTGSIKSHVSDLLKQNAARRQSAMRPVRVLAPKNSSEGSGRLPIQRPAPPRGRRPPQRAAVTMPSPPPERDSSSAEAPSSTSTSAAADATTAAIPVVATGSAAMETYDEEASHVSFLEALNEWRLGRAAEAVEALATTDTAATHDSGAGEGGALLGGQYNEAAGAASFREAVEAWRAGRSDTPMQQATAPRPSTSSTVQTRAVASAASVPITFSTTSSLSYVEKIMLERRRRDPAAISRAGATKTRSIMSAPPSTETVSVATDEEALEIEEVVADDMTGAEPQPLAYAVVEPDDDNNTTALSADPADGRPLSGKWCTPLMITPEYTPSPPPHENDVGDNYAALGEPGPAVEADTGVGAATAETAEVNVLPDDIVAESNDSDVDISSSGAAGILTASTAMIENALGTAAQLVASMGDGVPQGGDDNENRDIITPSLMDDFEEMEKSFTEE